jgi:hypothetical protein
MRASLAPERLDGCIEECPTNMEILDTKHGPLTWSFNNSDEISVETISLNKTMFRKTAVGTLHAEVWLCNVLYRPSIWQLSTSQRRTS